MKIAFTPDGWSDFAEWIATDRKKLNRVLRLIKECTRDPSRGLGEPEALRHDLSGWWSRKIDQEHRLVYRVATQNGEQVLEIAKCRRHYRSASDAVMQDGAAPD